MYSRIRTILKPMSLGTGLELAHSMYYLRPHSPSPPIQSEDVKSSVDDDDEGKDGKLRDC